MQISNYDKQLTQFHIFLLTFCLCIWKLLGLQYLKLCVCNKYIFLWQWFLSALMFHKLQIGISKSIFEVIISISIISSAIFVTYISTKIYHQRKNKRLQHNSLEELGFWTLLHSTTKGNLFQLNFLRQNSTELSGKSTIMDIFSIFYNISNHVHVCKTKCTSK